MLKPILLLLLLAITPLSSAFGYEYYEKEFDFVMTHDPIIYLVESDIENYSKYEALTIQSITEWERSLKLYTGNSQEWNLNLKKISSDDVDLLQDSSHDISIVFTDLINDEANGDTVLYDTGQKRIHIYNLSEREDSPILATIAHELGHSFGLGHYVSDSYKVYEEWNKGIHVPSIMTDQTSFQGIEKITELDLEEMVSIYGTDGFKELPSLIPEWIQNIFIWYGEGAIEDQELLDAIEYLVQNEIISDNK